MRIRPFLVRFLSMLVLMAIGGAAGFAVARFGEDRADKEKARQIERLRMELDASSRLVAQQGGILRRHSLGNASRSIDEMLTLLPAKFPQGNWTPSETLFEDCWFSAIDGIRLHGWYLPHPKPRAAVLYLHGNAGNLSHRGPAAQFLRDRFAVSVLVFDYRGYGRSEGVPTVEGILRDARAARRHLARRAEIPEAEVVLLGESLGGAVAVDLAAEDGAGGLILECTFSSLREAAAAHSPKLLANVLVADKLDSLAKIGRYRGPLLQCHGDGDRTVPFALGRKLFDAANEPKTFVTLPGRDHNDPRTEEYFQALDRFLGQLP